MLFDFEATMKLLAAFGTGAFVFVMIGLGIKVLFFRRPQSPQALDHEQLDGLDERLHRAEGKVQELEERLDFAERMLTEVRGRAQLPGS